MKDRTLLSSFLVSNTHDSGPGSLRQAILASNTATGGTNTIDFAIPGTGIQTITPLSPLPTITNPVLIDGTSQPGFAGTPLIDGTAGFPVGTDPTGLTVANLNGQPDLLVADTGSNDVSVLLGQGSGSSWTMIPGPRVQTDAGPVAMAVGKLLGGNSGGGTSATGGSTGAGQSMGSSQANDSSSDSGDEPGDEAKPDDGASQAIVERATPWERLVIGLERSWERAHAP